MPKMFTFDQIYDAQCPSCGGDLDDDGSCGWCSEHGNDLSREADHE